MENFSKKYNYENFETIAVVNKGMYNTFLVQDPFSGVRYIKKELSNEKLPIYQKLQNLKHQGLAEIIDIINKDNKTIVLIEYIVGESLKTILDRKIKLEEMVAVSYIRQLSSILNVVHQNGIIHRDINPSNIIITTNGQVKLIDFDIARFYKNSQTEDTQLLGTPGYAAPEQFGFNQSTASSDIYALGVLLNVMITGMKPNEMQIKNEELATVVKNCTAMEQTLRYQDVMQLDYDLRRLRQGVAKIPLKKETKKMMSFSKVGIIFTCIFLVFLSTVLFIYWWQQSQSPSYQPQTDPTNRSQNNSVSEIDDKFNIIQTELEYHFGLDFANIEFDTMTLNTTIRIDFKSTLPINDFQDATTFTRDVIVREMNERGIESGLSSDNERTIFEVYISLLNESEERTWQFVLGNHIAPGRQLGFVSGQLNRLPDQRDIMRIPIEEIQENIDAILLSQRSRPQTDSTNQTQNNDLPFGLTIIPSAISMAAPSLDTFMIAPETIFTTPASVNGLGDSYMVIQGHVDSWDSADEEGITFFYLTTNDGTLFFTIPEVDSVYDPFFDYIFDSRLLDRIEEGAYLRVYFRYLGFSDVLEKGGGVIIAFAEL